MTDRNDNLTTTDDVRDRDVAFAAPVAAQPVAAQPVAAQPVVAQPVVTETEPDYRNVMTEVDRPSRVPAFLAGFVTAIVVAAIAFVAFLAVSDSDDDGNIDVDVPAVEVDTGG
jgi:hypothetical protein